MLTCAEEDSSSVKKPKSSLVELRGRKLLFGQVPFERPPLPRRRKCNYGLWEFS
jgi:hypothetical protein